VLDKASAQGLVLFLQVLRRRRGLALHLARPEETAPDVSTSERGLVLFDQLLPQGDETAGMIVVPVREDDIGDGGEVDAERRGSPPAPRGSEQAVPAPGRSHRRGKHCSQSTSPPPYRWHSIAGRCRGSRRRFCARGHRVDQAGQAGGIRPSRAAPRKVPTRARELRS
jgi:hypothetical protein